MAIVQESYATDRMERAARAVARAVALNSQADPCSVIRREFRLSTDFDCGAEWQIIVDQGVSPLSTVIAGVSGDDDASGELVLVRIGWKPATPQDETIPVAMGVARSEPEAD